MNWRQENREPWVAGKTYRRMPLDIGKIALVVSIIALIISIISLFV